MIPDKASLVDLEEGKVTLPPEILIKPIPVAFQQQESLKREAQG